MNKTSLESQRKQVFFFTNIHLKDLNEHAVSALHIQTDKKKHVDQMTSGLLRQQ